MKQNCEIKLKNWTLKAYYLAYRCITLGLFLRKQRFAVSKVCETSDQTPNQSSLTVKGGGFHHQSARHILGSLVSSFGVQLFPLMNTDRCGTYELKPCSPLSRSLGTSQSRSHPDSGPRSRVSCELNPGAWHSVTVVWWNMPCIWFDGCVLCMIRVFVYTGLCVWPAP